MSEVRWEGIARQRDEALDDAQRLRVALVRIEDALSRCPSVRSPEGRRLYLAYLVAEDALHPGNASRAAEVEALALEFLR